MRGAPILAPGRCTGPWKHSGNISLFAKAQGATPRTNCWLLYTDERPDSRIAPNGRYADKPTLPTPRRASRKIRYKLIREGFHVQGALGATLHRGKAMRKASKQH